MNGSLVTIRGGCSTQRNWYGTCQRLPVCSSVVGLNTSVGKTGKFIAGFGRLILDRISNRS